MISIQAREHRIAGPPLLATRIRSEKVIFLYITKESPHEIIRLRTSAVSWPPCQFMPGVTFYVDCLNLLGRERRHPTSVDIYELFRETCT